MNPALYDGDRVFISSWYGELKRGDIIFFRNPKDTTKVYLKRVIGLPGEKVEILDGKVRIDNAELEESYLDKATFTRAFGDNNGSLTVQLGAGEFYVLGDNRDNSADSRVWGVVSKDKVIGKYMLTYINGERN